VDWGAVELGYDLQGRKGGSQFGVARVLCILCLTRRMSSMSVPLPGPSSIIRIGSDLPAYLE
jgi:hypothetical protein